MMNKPYDVEGKIALITGANRGIGKAIVAAFLKAGAAKVYTAVRTLESAASLVQEYGDIIVPIQIDLSEPETIAAVANTAKDVQVVVNNAGVLQASTPLDDGAIDALDFEMKINVFGLIRSKYSVRPSFRKKSAGHASKNSV